MLLRRRLCHSHYVSTTLQAISLGVQMCMISLRLKQWPGRWCGAPRASHNSRYLTRYLSALFITPTVSPASPMILHVVAYSLFCGLVMASLIWELLQQSCSMMCMGLQASLAKLLVYQPPSPPQAYKDLEARVAFLSEACEGDRALLSQVERLQRLAIPVQ